MWRKNWRTRTACLTQKLCKDMIHQPLISVIAAALNNERTIQRFIDSVSQQTYPNIELIIKDGGSTDGTIELLKRNNNRITYWESKSDTGIYNAWNEALDHAKGEWIIFLGADDYLWDSGVFEKLVSHLEDVQQNIKIVYCQVAIVDKEGNKLGVAGEPWKRIKRKFSQIMCIPHPATVCRRSMFYAYGKFDESFHIAGDFEFLLRELKHADAFFVPGLILTAMQHGGVSSTPENHLDGLKEMRVILKKHGQKLPGIYWLMSYLRVMSRVLLLNLIGKKHVASILDCGRSCTGKKPFWTRI